MDSTARANSRAFKGALLAVLAAVGGLAVVAWCNVGLTVQSCAGLTGSARLFATRLSLIHQDPGCASGFAFDGAAIGRVLVSIALPVLAAQLLTMLAACGLGIAVARVTRNVLRMVLHAFAPTRMSRPVPPGRRTPSAHFGPRRSALVWLGWGSFSSRGPPALSL